MNATAKENRLLRQEPAKTHEVGAHKDVIALLSDVVGMMGERLRGCAGTVAQKDREISSLTHLLSIYSGADSPTGRDPRGYESTKEFLAIAKTYEESKVDGAAEGGEAKTAAGEESPPDAPAKPCRGRLGHPGRSRHTRPDRTVMYSAVICKGCDNTDLELLDPIKKSVEDFWMVDMADMVEMTTGKRRTRSRGK